MQRICGVCTAVRAVASIRAVEDALKYPVPKQANLIRNLVLASQMVQITGGEELLVTSIDFV